MTKCALKDYQNERYKNKFFCECHWKLRRNKPEYKKGE